MNDLQDVLSDHSDYEKIELDAYMDAWDGGNPLFDLFREQDSCRAFVDAVTEEEFVMDVSPCEIEPDSHYRITPSDEDDIVDSLEALEQIGFEHFVPEPSQPGEDPLQPVFDAIKQAGVER